MTDMKMWKRNLKYMIENPWDAKGNSDHPDCPDCGCTMNFFGHDKNGDFPMGEGYWECPACNYSIREDDLDD